MSLLKQNNPFGLDISDLSLKLAQLKKEGQGFVLNAYSRTEIPSGIIEKGEIKKEEELIECLKKVTSQIKGQALKTKRCVVSLPETESFIDIITLPKMKPEELKEAVNWEIESHIPLKTEKVYLDWQIIEQPSTQTKDGKASILVGAMPKKIVNEYLAILKRAELEPIVFEIESIATARALVPSLYSKKPLMIIDFGAKRTSFIIFIQNTIVFTASTSFSNTTLIKKISKALNITEQEACRLKVAKGLGLLQEKRLQPVLEKELDELTSLIKKYINYFHSHLTDDHASGDLISKIILCGGGANLNGLSNLIAEKTNTETEIGNPWVNILKPPLNQVPEIPYEESVAFATTLGLALRGVDKYDLS